MLTKETGCRAALTVHKNNTVTCADRACTNTRSTESALATHSFIVSCRQPECPRCSTARRLAAPD